MWISRRAFEQLTAERIQASERARVLSDQNTAIKAMNDWLRLYVQRIEHERAILMKKYMGIIVPTPTFAEPEQDDRDLLGGTSLFQDVGDEQAKKLGIDWADDGTLKAPQ